METRLQRQRCRAARNWAAMDPDILCSIFNCLPFVDLHRVKSVCWGWHNTTDLLKGCSAASLVPEMPWLVFTPPEEYEITEGEKTGRFVNIEENKIYPFNDLAVEKMNDGFCLCIGSSHDWLICLDGKALPYLLNPFTSHRIDLPRIGVSLGVKRVSGTGKNCYMQMVSQYVLSRVNFVRKAALSSSPSLGSNYYLVMIYGLNSQLAFCKDGDTSWTTLNSDPTEHYADIHFHGNQLYGLDSGPEVEFMCLRVWDMNQKGFLLVRKVDIVLDDTRIMMPVSRVLHFNFYLVESLGNFLVASRLVPKPGSHGSSQYRTSEIKIFKVDFNQKMCELVTSLHGFALFLGRNHSISVDVRSSKRFKPDCIYFTDDYPGNHQRENPFYYSGHDLGRFSLKDGRFYWLYGKKNENLKSGPTWVVPHVKRLK